MTTKETATTTKQAAARQRAFAQLDATFRSGVTRPLCWRKAQLDAMARMLRQNATVIARAVRADLGKPAAETALMEIGLVLDEIRFIKPRLGRWAARHPKPMHYLLQPAVGWTVAEPKGVALIISPWNYPVLLSFEPMADAIAAGNCVCMKPSELSPHTSGVMADLIARYMDPQAFRVVQGGPQETTKLLEQPFNHIFYTGGGKVGSIVMAAAAKHLTHRSLWSSEASRRCSSTVPRTSTSPRGALPGGGSSTPGRPAWHPTMCSQRPMSSSRWQERSPRPSRGSSAQTCNIPTVSDASSTPGISTG